MSLVLSAFSVAPGHPLTVVRPLAASFALGAILSGIAVAIIRRPIPAAAVASLVIIGLYGGRELSGLRGLALGLIVILLWFIRVRWRAMHGSPAPDVSLSLVVGGASVLLIAGLATAVMAHGSDPRDWTGRSAQATASRLPSIYVLLLDGYPNGDTLRDTYAVDNEPFLSSLESLGFDVARESRSTHYATELSLLGMLSGRTEITEAQVFSSAPAGREVRRQLRSAPGTAALRDAGYELVTLTSPVDGVMLDSWDRVISNGHLSDFEIALLGDSLFGPQLGDVIMDDLRSRVTDEFRDLVDLADPSVQRTVLVHVMAPHPPFLWDERGQGAHPPACWPQNCGLFTSSAAHLNLPLDEYVRQMTAQVAHLNGLTLASIRAVVERDPTGIVVVMSDHGSRYSDSDPEELYRNLFAIRSPTHPDLGSHPTPDDLFVNLLSMAESAPKN